MLGLGSIKGAFGMGKSSGYTPVREDFENPYAQKDRAVDLGRAKYYDAQSRTGFKNMGMAGQNLNRNAAGYNPLINHLTDMSNGVGPSLAQMQLQDATNRNIQNQAGIAASNPGMNPAMAQRMMGQNVAGMNQQAAGQSGQLRLQEQMDAMGQLLAARQAQGQTYGAAGNLFGNTAQLGASAGMNYQNLGQQQAELDRQAMMKYNEMMAKLAQGQSDKLGSFFSKMGSGLGSLVGNVPWSKIGKGVSTAGGAQSGGGTPYGDPGSEYDVFMG